MRTALVVLTLALLVVPMLRTADVVVPGKAVPVDIECTSDAEEHGNTCWVGSLEDDRFPRLWMERN